MQADLGVVIETSAFGFFLISVPLFILALITAPWQSNESEPIKFIWPLMCALVLLIWQMDISLLDDALHIHLLGACLMTVLFGWQLAFIGLCVVLATSSLINEVSLAAVALNSIGLIVVPVFSSYLIVVIVFRLLPRHFFVFIFLSGFANAVISILCAGLVSGILMDLFSNLSSDQIWGQLLPAFTLMLFPEAFTTGAILTLFVVYKPHWVRSFHDRLYLNK